MSWVSGTANGYLDLLARLFAFLVVGHALPPSYSGVGTGTIDGLIGTDSSVQETISVVFSSATEFAVSGSVTGSMGAGTVGTAFSHARVSFSISAGSTAWVANDAITFVMTAPWVALQDMVGWVASSMWSDGTQPRSAFDGDPNTHWGTANGSIAGTLEADFGANHAITQYSIQARNDADVPSTCPQAWTFEYWDGTAWVVGDTRSAQTAWTKGQKRVFTLAAPASAKRFRLNITANNGSTANTTVAEFGLYETSGGVNVALLGCFWKAPGNAGVDEIFVGIQPYYHSAADYYNWRLAASIGHTAGALFAAQPGAVTDCHLPLRSGSTPYWFSANGKRVAIVANVSGVYESAYLGFPDTYASPGQFPYPIFVGGSMRFASEPASDSTDWRWSNTGAAHSAFWQSWNGSAAAARLRKFDGSWQTFDGGGLPKATSGLGSMWPYVVGANLAGMQFLDANLDGTRPLFPIVPNDSSGCYGELDGIAAASGYLQASEDTITVDRIPWLLIPNTFRQTRNTYAALRLA